MKALFQPLDGLCLLCSALEHAEELARERFPELGEKALDYVLQQRTFIREKQRPLLQLF